MVSLGTAPIASIFVEYPPNCVVVARRGPTVPKCVKLPTGPRKETDSVTPIGADAMSTAKRTSTGRSSPL